MSLKSKIVIGMLSLMGTYALADDGAAASATSTGTEFFHQAAPKAWEVTPTIDYHDYSVKYGNDNGFQLSKAETTGESVSVKGEYGINDMFSAGAKLKYTNDTLKLSASDATTFTNGTNSGMSNVQLYGMGKYDLGMGMLHYGLNLDISLAKNKCTLTGDGQNGVNIKMSCNEDTGGTGLTPWAGYDMNLGPGTIGTRLSWSFLVSNRKAEFDNNAQSPATQQTTTETGGQLWAWSVFYEYNMAPWTLGASLTWNSVNGNTDTDSTGTTAGTAVKADTGHAGLMLNLYAPVKVTETITILPNFSYGDPGTVVVNDSGVNTVSGWMLGCGARFVF